MHIDLMSITRHILSFLILLSILLPVQTTKIQCQLEPNSFQRGKSFVLSQREELVSTMYGFDVIVDRLDGTVSHIIRQWGTWEGHLLRTMARFVKEGDTVLNIGSHIGLEAIVLGKIAGPKGRLFIMQPFSITYNMVLKNVYFNGLADIAYVYNAGASNKYSKGIISVINSNTGGSQIFTDQTIARPSIKSEEVTVDRVDDVLPKDAVINFALIDVQSSEVECLQGMKETIARSPNIVIECEWSSRSNSSKDLKNKIKALLDWFSSLKFKFYRVDKIIPRDCSPLLFRELSIDYIMSMPDPADGIFAPDIFFIPGHIDPNKTF